MWTLTVQDDWFGLSVGGDQLVNIRKLNSVNSCSGYY